MNNLEFSLSKNKWVLHWNNWEDFVNKKQSVLNQKNNEVCILFVCCNSYNLFSKCLEYLWNESNQNFDILVVDNSTDEDNINLFNNLWIKNKKVSILRPIDNIGWSWWFSMWLEYIISQEYKKLVIFEDDIIPVDDDIISEMIKISDDTHIIKNSYVNIPECECWVFHLVLYPIEVLKKIWVSDPRYFLKCDDTDFAIRLKKDNIQTKFTWKHLFHPNLKRDWRKNRVFAFSVRNELVLLQNHFSISFMIKLIAQQFLYLWYWISKLFLEKNLWVLKIYFWSLMDFIKWHIWYRYNLKLLNKYRCVDISKLNLKTEEIDVTDFSKKSKDKYYLYLKFVHYEWILWNFTFSNKFSKSKNGIIAWWILCPLYPIFMLFKNIIFLEEFMYESNTVKYEYYENEIYLKTLIMLAFSLLISIFLRPFIIIILLIKYIFKFFKEVFS